ncbi:hypothetical protein TWF694_009103 [Orbilia ellipsospora]|uniref:Fucose-specific lectin n=1 Tax=Orbilia ellipsospora TaxID=2528407 RepID=A0AAV9XDW2_9PEZI
MTDVNRLLNPVVESSERILKTSAVAAVNVFDYRRGRMYINLYCQSESTTLYRMQYLYRNGTTPTSPTWKATPILDLSESPALNTPLAAVVHVNKSYTPFVHLFYVDRERYIREVMWIRGVMGYEGRVEGAGRVMRGSRLGVCRWWREGRDGVEEVYIRLFYQSETGQLQEHRGVFVYPTSTTSPPTSPSYADNTISASGSGSARTTILNIKTTWSPGPILNFPQSPPLQGTDLAFITPDPTHHNTVGYFQTTTGEIKQLTFDGKSWKISSDFTLSLPSGYSVLLGTGMAAAVVNIRGSRQARLFYVGIDERDTERRVVMKTVVSPAPYSYNYSYTSTVNAEENCNYSYGYINSEGNSFAGKVVSGGKVEGAGRIAAIQTDAGFYAWVGGGRGMVELVSPETRGEPFGEEGGKYARRVGVEGVEASWGDD